MVEYSPIPDNVRELVRERVHAIEQIEVLLRLHAVGGASLSAAELGAALRLPEALVQGALDHLVLHKLVTVTRDRFQCQPSDPVLAAAVDALAISYADARVEMLRLISANSVERLRSNTLRVFAEAFRLRGKKKDG